MEIKVSGDINISHDGGTDENVHAKFHQALKEQFSEVVSMVVDYNETGTDSHWTISSEHVPEHIYVILREFMDYISTNGYVVNGSVLICWDNEMEYEKIIFNDNIITHDKATTIIRFSDGQELIKGVDF